MKVIVLATPHARNDALFEAIASELTEYKIIRISNKNELSFENLSLIKPEWIFFPHWSWIIPSEIHQSFNCVIFHMTDLPYGRGGSPLQNLIIRGHTETKLTALKCVDEIDGGPIFAQRELSLKGKAEEILLRTSSLIEELIVWIVKNQPIPIEQKGEIVIFTRRRPEDGNIENVNDLIQAYDYIRMMDADGYPPAFILSKNMKFEFTDASLSEEYIEAKVRIRKK